MKTSEFLDEAIIAHVIDS